MDDNFVVSEVDHLFVRIVVKNYDSFETLDLDFFRVDRREHFSKRSPYHFSLRIDSESIEDGQRIFKTETKLLSSVMDNVFHSAIVDYSEDHLPSSEF